MVLSAQSVFRSRSFSLYFFGQALSYAGDGLRTIAIPLLIYHLTKSASALGLTYTLELLPFTIFGLVGGSLADRLDRRKLMIWTDFVRFAIILAWIAAYTFGLLSLWMLYAGIAAMSMCAAVFQGGQASSIPYLLGRDRATRAVAALAGVEQAVQMVMPPLGGALFALVGPLPALIANAGTYLCSQVSVALVETLGPAEPSGMPAAAAIATDITAGFAYFWSDVAMRQITFIGLLFNFFGLMTAAVLIPYFKVDFGASDTVVGISLGAAAIGALAGSIAAVCAWDVASWKDLGLRVHARCADLRSGDADARLTDRGPLPRPRQCDGHLRDCADRRVALARYPRRARRPRLWSGALRRADGCSSRCVAGRSARGPLWRTPADDPLRRRLPCGQSADMVSTDRPQRTSLAGRSKRSKGAQRGADGEGRAVALDLLDRYLLGEAVPKAELVKTLLANPAAAPSAAPFYRALAAVGARAADEAFIALRLVLRGEAPTDGAVRELRGLVARARGPEGPARESARAAYRARVGGTV